MTDADKEAFEKLMMRAELATVSANGKDLRALARLLFEELRPYTFEAVDAAVREHCRRNRFFPMPADIVNGIEGDLDERAALAWAEVDAAALKTRGDRSVRFPDPVIHWAIGKMRGWESVARGIVNGDTSLKKEFATLYRCGVKHFVTWADVPAVLEGTFTRNVYDAAAGKCFPARDLPALEAAS